MTDSVPALPGLGHLEPRVFFPRCGVVCREEEAGYKGSGSFKVTVSKGPVTHTHTFSFPRDSITL